MQIGSIKWFQEKFCHLGEGLLAIRAPQPMQKFFSLWPPAAATRRCRLIEGNKVLRRLAKPLFRYLYLIATGKFALHPEWFQIAGHVIPKWTANDPRPQVIPKWSRKENQNGLDLGYWIIVSCLLQRKNFTLQITTKKKVTVKLHLKLCSINETQLMQTRNNSKKYQWK